MYVNSVPWTPWIPRDDLGTSGRLMYTYKDIYFILYHKLLSNYTASVSTFPQRI